MEEVKQPEAKEADYKLASVFQCPHCKNAVAITDPKFVASCMASASIKFKHDSPKCGKDIILRPGKIPQKPTNSPNRHQRRANGSKKYRKTQSGILVRN